jgi:hypothetical protein
MALGVTEPIELTNAREVWAFLFAQALKIAAFYVLSLLVLEPFYQTLYNTGGALLIPAISIALSAVFLVAALPLFLWFRGLLGGVAVWDHEHDFTTSRLEIGAYLIGCAAVIVIVTAVSYWYVIFIHVPRRPSGYIGYIPPFNLAHWGGIAVGLLALFAALRREFLRRVQRRIAAERAAARRRKT